MIAQIFEGHTKLVVEFNGKFDSLYTYLNGKINNLRSHISVSSSTTSSVNAVTLHNGSNPRRSFSENFQKRLHLVQLQKKLQCQSIHKGVDRHQLILTTLFYLCQVESIISQRRRNLYPMVSNDTITFVDRHQQFSRRSQAVTNPYRPESTPTVSTDTTLVSIDTNIT